MEDDGVGIPESQWANVFTLFTPLGNEQRSNVVGHGLGLAIVKQIIQWHGGTIDLHQSDLGGAKFVMSWPKNNPESKILFNSKLTFNV